MQAIGNYTIIQKLAEGADSEVYLARLLPSNSLYAIKILKLNSAALAEPLQLSFSNEAALMRQFTGKSHLIELIDAHTTAGENSYIVMPYYRRSLFDWMASHTADIALVRSSQHTVKVLAFIRQLLLGLSHLHQTGLVHRDIKPANLLLDDDDNVVLADLGLAVMADDRLPAVHGDTAPAGTTEYASPEQQDTNKKLSLAADIYSVGVLLYKLLSANGKLQDCHNLARINAYVPLALRDLILQCVSVDPLERPQDAKALLVQIDTISPFDIGEKTQMFVAREADADADGNTQQAQAHTQQASTEQQTKPIENRGRNSTYRGLVVLALIAAVLFVATLFWSPSWLTLIDSDTQQDQQMQSEQRGHRDTNSAEQEKTSANIAEALAMGTVRVNAQPAQAIILLINEQAQQIPLQSQKLKTIPQGTYTLRLSKNGYQTHTQLVQVTGTGVNVNVALALSDSRYFIGSSQPMLSDGEPIEFILLPPNPELPARIRMMSFEMTNAVYQQCVKEGACEAQANTSDDPRERLFVKADHPIVRVSWQQIVDDFIPWLSAITGSTVRLPSEAEWEYAAYAGTQSDYSWGNEVRFNQAHCRDCNAQNLRVSAAVKSYAPNLWGLYDMHGNVQEWTQDCYQTPSNGVLRCDQAIVKGGSWLDERDKMKIANRNFLHKQTRSHTTGFRLVEVLND